jgi:hypothetical protein
MPPLAPICALVLTACAAPAPAPAPAPLPVEAPAPPSAELATLMPILAASPGLDGREFDPGALIAAVNALQPLGKDRALAVLTEYLRTVPRDDTAAREPVFLILRALFEAPADPGYHPPMRVGAPSPAAPADPKQIPRFPLVIERDVPFLLVTGYVLGGEPQDRKCCNETPGLREARAARACACEVQDPEDHLAWYAANATMRAAPLSPGSELLGAMRAVLYADGSLYGSDPTDAGRMLEHQLQRLVAWPGRADARCLPVVAAECGCVYSCGVGDPGDGGKFTVHHPFWGMTPLTAHVDRWCVGDACTDALFADIVCDGICTPKPADATCHFEGALCVGTE